MRAVYAESRGAYGWPRIWRELRQGGIRVGKQRVQQLMQQPGIRARGKRRLRVTTQSQSRPGLPVAENLLNRRFTVTVPNQVWAGDITYIETNEGWLYLAVVLDLFNRQVIGWALAEDLRQELVVDAFQMAWFRRGLTRQTGLLFHRDRGSQYAGEAFQNLLRQYGVQPSMSRTGNCSRQCLQRDAVRITESGALAWAALRDSATGERRSAGLAARVQPQTVAFDAALYEPEGVRTGVEAQGNPGGE
jgi:transposase InsO family protein